MGAGKGQRGSLPIDALRVLRKRVRTARTRLQGLFDLPQPEQVEGVHQARVALRRLRTILKTYAAALPRRRRRPWLRSLRRAARELGQVRDLDVQSQWLGERLQETPTPRIHAGVNRVRLRIGQARDLAHKRADKALGKLRRKQTLQELLDWLDQRLRKARPAQEASGSPQSPPAETPSPVPTPAGASSPAAGLGVADLPQGDPAHSRDAVRQSDRAHPPPPDRDDAGGGDATDDADASGNAPTAAGLTAQAREVIGRSLEALLAFAPVVDQADQPEQAEALHAMRIAAKRLRYTLEVFQAQAGPVLDPFVDAARQAQDLLGLIHDSDVWAQWLDCFEAEETQRIREHTGSTQGIARFRPGIAWLRQDRARQRAEHVREFQRLWRDLEDRGCWDRLADLLRSGPSAAAEADPVSWPQVSPDGRQDGST